MTRSELIEAHQMIKTSGKLDPEVEMHKEAIVAALKGAYQFGKKGLGGLYRKFIKAPASVGGARATAKVHDAAQAGSKGAQESIEMLRKSKNPMIRSAAEGGLKNLPKGREVLKRNFGRELDKARGAFRQAGEQGGHLGNKLMAAGKASPELAMGAGLGTLGVGYGAKKVFGGRDQGPYGA